MIDLFGKKTIRSISFDEQEIINAIIYLHHAGQEIECDPTYSIGSFYKNREKPKYKFDVKPQLKDVVFATAEKLPLESESIKVLMFDPPFLSANGSTKTDNTKSIMRNRFSFVGLHTEDLWRWYSLCLKEFMRVLKNNGTVIFKCQDVAGCGKNYFSHKVNYLIN